MFDKVAERGRRKLNGKAKLIKRPSTSKKEGGGGECLPVEKRNASWRAGTKGKRVGTRNTLADLLK